MNVELRKIEKLDGDDWVEIPMRDVKKGDLIRMFEPDGEQVKDESRVCAWYADQDAKEMKEYPGVYGVEVSKIVKVVVLDAVID